MTLVIDASVAVKWFVEEPLRDEARNLIQGNDPLCAPDLLFAEIANIGWKLVRRGDIESDQALEMITEVGDQFSTVISSSLLCERAFHIALALGHPVYDCLYLTCAEVADAMLVTADERFYAATQGGPHAELIRHLSDFSP
jgi:predicted nucleic acid-binding protein